MLDTATSEDDTNFLVAIIDTNPLAWQQSANAKIPLSLDDAIRQILLFFNAHIAFKHDNKIACLASHIGHCKFLYPVTEEEENRRKTNPTMITKDANVYPNFKLVNDDIIESLKILMEDTETPQKNMNDGTFDAPWLTFAKDINRIIKQDDLGRIKPRVLVLSVSPDSPYQYISIMNAVFSAQKMSIPIDVCKIFGGEVAFLQQAAHITGGVYLDVENPQALLQYLLFSFLPERYARNYLCLPNKEQVDFRAACFCHKRIIDIGYVCSSFVAGLRFARPAGNNLELCLTKFAFRALPPLQGKGRPGASRTASPAPTAATSPAANSPMSTA
ncbi:RNA polymerase II transcription factor B subunit 4 [Umbelopsis nana]